SGYHLAYLVGAGLAAGSGLIAIFVLRPVQMPAMDGGGMPGTPGDGDGLPAGEPAQGATAARRERPVRGDSRRTAGRWEKPSGRATPRRRFRRKETDVQSIPEQITQARAAFAEAPDERARMGRISGVLWMVSAMVGLLDLVLPGSHHDSPLIVIALGIAIF